MNVIKYIIVLQSKQTIAIRMILLIVLYVDL